MIDSGTPILDKMLIVTATTNNMGPKILETSHKKIKNSVKS